MNSPVEEEFKLEDLQAFIKTTSDVLNNIEKPEYKIFLIQAFRQMSKFNPKLQKQLCDVWDFKIEKEFDKIKRNTMINDCLATFLIKEVDPASEVDNVIVETNCKPKVNKDSLSCSHGNSVCIHHFSSSRGCDLGEGCRFCHEDHPEQEQAQLVNEANTEYAKRGRHSGAVIVTKTKSQPLTPPPEPVYDSGLVPSTPNESMVTVSSFIDYLKQISFNIVFHFAVVLYSTQPNALRDAENDIRKYLFHISRHAAVIAGVAKVPIDGVSAGILLFRIAAHMESVPDTQFRTLVRQYVAFLDSISIQQPPSDVIRFENAKHIYAKMELIFFPGGFTFPLTSKDLQQNYKTKGPSTPPEFTSSSESETLDPLRKATPAINVRELHRRKLCVACRHYLRGMCYRGEACNFCHNPEHQAEYERSTSNQRLPEKK